MTYLLGNMYNMVHGINPIAAFLMAVLNIETPLTTSIAGSPVGGPWHSGRFRDAFLNKDGSRIIMFTRNGGDNRKHWSDSKKAAGPDCDCPGCIITYSLPKHPCYIRDWDDDFDRTYAYVEFSVPDTCKDMIGSFATGEDPVPFRQKFEAAMKELQTLSKEQIEADPRFNLIIHTLREATGSQK